MCPSAGWKNLVADLILKPGRDKSLLRRHPWIFSGAIQYLDGDPKSGETVNLLSSDGDFLARAAYSPHSQIRARVWSFSITEDIDSDFFANKIRQSVSTRLILELEKVTDAYRLINAESDGLPGLFVDRYGDILVLQSLTAGSDFWKDIIADILFEETGVSSIFERSDAEVRGLENLKPVVGRLRGIDPNIPQVITEYELKYNINFESGHKTGFYLDQRDNRFRLRQLAEGRDVLDCFCYTGGFSINALIGGARSIIAVDSSAEALDQGRENLALNVKPAQNMEWCRGDVFTVLRDFRDQGRSFDLIVLDPPKFAPTAAQAQKASRGYKDINLLALKLLRSEGILVTFSCSGGVDPPLFQKIVASAALDASTDLQIMEYLSQAMDHPIAINFPEAGYLKGLVCLKL